MQRKLFTKIDQGMKSLMRPVDIVPLALFRIFFGVTIAYHVFKLHPPEVIRQKFILPELFLSFDLFHFLHLAPWPVEGMYVHFFVMGVAGLGIALGFYYRFSLTIFFLSFGYTFFLEKAYFNNHYYLFLLIAFLLFLMGAHRWGTVDSVIDPSIRVRQVPFWNIFILRAQIFLVYFIAGLVKINPDWLRGMPMRVMLEEKCLHISCGPAAMQELWAYFLSYGGILFDLSIGFLLCFHRTRNFGLGLAILFHFLNNWLFEIGAFPLFMLLALILFVKAEQIHRVIDYLKARIPYRFSSAPKREQSMGKGNPCLVLAFIVVYLFIQIVVPFRHYLYPGDANWTTEGQRFAWRMKLNYYDYFIRVFVTDHISGEVMGIDPYIHFQERTVSMARHPRMIWEYVQHIKNNLSEQGVENPVIRVDARIGLNGRPLVPLIDPNVNLAQEPYPLFSHAPWIMPHPDLQ